MSKKFLAVSLIVTVTITLIAILAAFGQEEEVELVEIPGITVEDTKPAGCIDCHRKVSEERDYRLTRYIEELARKEEHPDVVAAMNTIPTDCMTCHSKTAAKALRTEPFATMQHRIHLVGGEENHFITVYQGNCTWCHAFNTETGQL
ncbi:hypothetical protein IBX65_07655, partial [Candidatus Aerophobetes bacterium]|nr:hypothetical protein [Candidatus Aerophobetes bacterium]